MSIGKGEEVKASLEEEKEREKGEKESRRKD